LAMFFAAAVADLLTYVVTALQLTLAYHDVGFMTAFSEFLTTFAVTQIPLAIIEGILFAMFATYLVNNKPEIFDSSAGENASESKEASA